MASPFTHRRRVPAPGLRGVAAALLLVPLLAGPLPAATREAPVPEPAGRGEPMEQRFLSPAVSVVTTPRGPSCVASARIDIAASGYWDAGGAALPFERIRRSPATSIQAIAGPDGATAFRVQLKFSPRPGAPLTLALGDGTPAIDLRPLLEPDTDSVLIAGGDARALAAAFRGERIPTIEATSRDTGHRVRDALPAPDLGALAACAASLDPAARPGPLAGRVSLRFEARPDPASLATPERLRACGMAPGDRPLHRGRLTATTGVFAQVDTVLVAFDEAGRVERAYVPGIVDADLADPAAGTLRVSQAADGNVPDAPNAVTGCIGAREVQACLRADGAGAFALEACGAFSDGPGLGGPGLGGPGSGGPGSGLVSDGPGPGAVPPQVAALTVPGRGDPGPGGPDFPSVPPLTDGGDPNPGDTDPPGGGGPDPNGPDPGGPNPPPIEPPIEPPVVPLPATALLLLTGLLGLLGGGLARRRG